MVVDEPCRQALTLVNVVRNHDKEYAIVVWTREDLRFTIDSCQRLKLLAMPDQLYAVMAAISLISMHAVATKALSVASLTTVVISTVRGAGGG